MASGFRSRPRANAAFHLERTAQRMMRIARAGLKCATVARIGVGRVDELLGRFEGRDAGRLRPGRMYPFHEEVLDPAWTSATDQDRQVFRTPGGMTCGIGSPIANIVRYESRLRQSGQPPHEAAPTESGEQNEKCRRRSRLGRSSHPDRAEGDQIARPPQWPTSYVRRLHRQDGRRRIGKSPPGTIGGRGIGTVRLPAGLADAIPRDQVGPRDLAEKGCQRQPCFPRRNISDVDPCQRSGDLSDHGRGQGRQLGNPMPPASAGDSLTALYRMIYWRPTIDPG